MTSCDVQAPRRGPRRFRRALTMVELLVVVMIIGIIAALLLPAISSVRDAAYNVQCKSNLRQIGLAISAYHESRGRLPSGWVGYGDSDEPGWGWASDLLNYIEHGNLASEISRRNLISDQQHAAVRQTVIPVFDCPLDSTPTTFSLDVQEGRSGDSDAERQSIEMARANYAGVFGSDGIDDNPNRGNGLFYRNSKLRLRSISDGLNNTLMVGERSSRLGATTWVGVVPGASSARARVVGTAETVPNDVLGHFESFSSYHSGTTNFLTAGGAVKSIADDVDIRLFRAMTTRSGGEKIDDSTEGGDGDDGGGDDGDDGGGDNGGGDDGDGDDGEYNGGPDDSGADGGGDHSEEHEVDEDDGGEHDATNEHEKSHDIDD